MHMPVTRRAFFKRLLWSTAGVGAAAGGYATLIEPRLVEINRLRIVVRDLPRAFDGLTIAQLSDLHRSSFVSADYLQRCIALANALTPDLIVFTGDYLTHRRLFNAPGRTVYGDKESAIGLVRDSVACMARARAKHGVLASLGNHDHWFDGGEVSRMIQAAGIPVLRNASTTLRIHGEPLPIVGLGDLWTEGVRFERAFAGADAPFALVLMHNPDSFEHWPRAGSHLVLAGHTHGGQVNLPLIGPPIVPSGYGRKYAQGLFRRGDAQMYVNRGIGLIAPPVRLNCRPEIALFRLTRA